MPQQFARTGGHGYTFLEWMGNPILYVKTINHVSPQPIAQPAVIQPMNHIRPMEIAGPRAIGHGMLTIEIIEGWQAPIWKQLASPGSDVGEIKSATDLADIFDWQNRQGTPIHITQMILAPSAVALGNSFGGGIPDRSNIRYDTYHGCKVGDLRNGEQVGLDTIEITKQIDIWYTHCTIFPNPASGGRSHVATSVQDSSEGSQKD